MTQLIPASRRYVSLPDRAMTIEEGIALINRSQADINRLWQYLLCHHWNIGAVGIHLTAIYGPSILDDYSDELDLSVTVIRECIGVVRWFRRAQIEWNRNGSSVYYDTAEAYFEEFISSPDERGKPIRWYHLQNLIQSNVRPGVLSASDLTRRLIAIMEDNNRALERINQAARRLPPKERADVLTEAAGVEVAYTEEAAEFVRNGHTILDPPTVHSKGPASHSYRLHRIDQPPDEGEPLGEFPNTLQALTKALKTLGYHVTISGQ